MHRTQSHRSKAKYLKRRKGFMSSVKGVSHLSRRAKRRLFFKVQLWMWRKRREKCRFGIFRAKRRACGISCGPCFNSKDQSQKNKSRLPMYHTVNSDNSRDRTSAAVSPLACDTEASEETLRGQNCPLKPHEPVSLSETLIASSSFQNRLTDMNVPGGPFTLTASSQRRETSGRCCVIAEPSKHSRTVKPLLRTEACEGMMRCTSGQCTSVTPGQDKASNTHSDERITCQKSSQTNVSLKALTNDLHEFLDEFYRIYGSFIPLQKSDVLRHLKRKFNTDFRDRKYVVFSEVTKYRSVIVQKPVPSFQVVYNKHTLTLEDLSTLADQNWLNDQVMNMYGELIVESAHHKVHFLNSFFHRQLMTKGYDGVKRWTKQNILKYLMAEAKEKQQTAFENGWTVSFDENVPQQTNENDCGVFVLEYSRCLALTKPLQFSQEDIPKIRKRIYKELCDCKLHEEG
ncbi:sentrin-specific protease 5-like isoform X2 [Paralichthys olivaceus]|uniref:sentrin-specific protease 5-like isoform X2 n=1 Tax=Paralichthys olivaceus TaxID=8255 RepID=UPI0037514F74